MKKILWIVIFALVIGLFGGFVMNEIGYQRIIVEDGILYAKTENARGNIVVIIVSGSGPTDMDGNSSLVPGRNDGLAQLAQALKKRGVSTLRYDKRTAGKSAQSFRTETMDFDLFVSDCEAVIRHVRSMGYKKIYLAGHSQGSLVAMLAAVSEPVDGIISIAGAGHPIDITLERQLTPQIGADSREIAILKELREGNIDNTVPTSDLLMSPNNQRFLISWMRYDPTDTIRELDCPVLIVQGSSDLQVDKSEFDALATARQDAESIWISGMNHVLKSVKNEQENVMAYTDPSFNIDEQLVETIVGFVS